MQTLLDMTGMDLISFEEKKKNVDTLFGSNSLNICPKKLHGFGLTNRALLCPLLFNILATLKPT
jgi:hypothetical protein